MSFGVAPLDYPHLVVKRQQRLGQPGDAASSLLAPRSRVFEPDEEVASRAWSSARRGARGFGLDRLVHATVELVLRAIGRDRLGGVISEPFHQFRTRHSQSNPMAGR